MTASVFGLKTKALNVECWATGGGGSQKSGSARAAVQYARNEVGREGAALWPAIPANRD